MAKKKEKVIDEVVIDEEEEVVEEEVEVEEVITTLNVTTVADISKAKTKSDLRKLIPPTDVDLLGLYNQKMSILND